MHVAEALSWKTLPPAWQAVKSPAVTSEQVQTGSSLAHFPSFARRPRELTQGSVVVSHTSPADGLLWCQIRVRLCSRQVRKTQAALNTRQTLDMCSKNKVEPSVTEHNQSRRSCHATGHGGAGRSVSHDRRNPVTHEQLGASTPAVSSAAQTSFSEIKPPKHTYACLRHCVRQWEG